MLLGNIRDDMHSNCRTSRSVPQLMPSFSMNDTMISPSFSSSQNFRTPITSQQTMMNYARMSYRYTTVTLLSMRPPPETTIFPDHLIERRFLDDENYIDLDRMLNEKAGKFRLDSYGIRDGAGDGPILPTRMHKYDYSDPVIVEKVKNRRPKDPLTPHQVAALTSVVTRHQPSAVPTSLLSTPHQNSSSQVWIDDYSHRQAQNQRNTNRYHQPSQPSMPYQRQNLNQSEIHSKPIRSLLPNYRSNNEQNPNTNPILQRLFQAQHHQQNRNEIENQQSSPYINNLLSTSEHYHNGLSAFCTPTTPEPSNSYNNNTFAWPFSTNQNQKNVTHPLHIPMATQTTVKQNQDVLAQLVTDQLRCSTSIQTPSTPIIDINKSNNSNRDNTNDDDDDFYSAPPSPTQQNDSLPSLFDTSNNPEHTRIYNQAVLLNSLIRNTVNENNIQNSSSNESCFSNDTQSTNWNQEQNESYTEMNNLIRLLSPGVKNITQQELLQYLEQGCSNEREQMLHLIETLNINEQNSLKPILVRLINEQLNIMKNQKQIQQGNPLLIPQEYSQETRSPLESWFGSSIYTNAYPRMPSGSVVSAYDLEETRLAQKK
ncbi:unnamed protein product [Adineta steineri]|uniref:Uncharacterized protein n=1 Tax=Adineta steineri TaxID=433720 RepID=A0A814SIS2_9BILA|nr:unnamed protein product [Adineta steineri]CAF1148702.1 unnamed protein product [Adineta steineri]CAF1275231.1 unnamed protein product [Adineta steineri]CAF1474017.1 unnamed protein product [Adineta steineri]